MTPSAPACVLNLGPRQARKRLLFGVGFLALGLLGKVAFSILGLSTGWRMTLFLPFWFGVLGVLQARTRT